MVHEVLAAEWFIPEWKGNKEKPEEDQIGLLIEAPTGVSTGEAAMKAGIGVSDNKDGQILIYDFCLFCKGVRNLKLKMPDGKKRDARPEDIVTTPGLDGLFTEARQYYSERYFVDKKKLLSDSTSGLKGSQSSQKKTTKTQPEL